MINTDLSTNLTKWQIFLSLVDDFFFMSVKGRIKVFSTNVKKWPLPYPDSFAHCTTFAATLVGCSL